MKTYETLHQQLENARQQLYDLHNQYGIEHTSVLEQSMLLDELINQYNRIFQSSLCKTNPPNE
ncbi:aspartyl-phosphate phosphatase Spo0E family protein [Paenibacillus kribbensis]|uniref:Spo0E family sporulation regulatory protein-aspartic acid phosphatase n=1 Tax=Paenibacillus kribbensis TaxID=172713 RepID=A0A222WH71_9BACL|nr:aspartyl-phosphate phosphatase Spo0E family protein [Paenibacillus kribbensis]ASR45332.1 Spo0E family sporulation regulatory protein-aspartic acid phosphatase [Paenibacillus kribbensis]